jgi:hypothetical protein
MSTSSFENKKELRFVITLGTGSFGSSNANTIVLRGFRASATIEKAGGTQNTTLQARIYGVAESDVNAITTLSYKRDEMLANTVTVTAIDGNQQMQIFSGNIIFAAGNYQSQPDVFLEIQAITAFVAQLTPVPPSSYQGSIDVATIAGQIVILMNQSAGKNQYVLENNGVTTQLSNTYLAGTALDQLKTLVRNAGVDLYVDDDIVAICPRGVARRSLIPLISPQSGLVGYPSFTSIGVRFRCLFNPSILFGGQVSIQSPIPKANGQFQVLTITHQLEAETPGGAWYSEVECINQAIAGGGTNANS